MPKYRSSSDEEDTEDSFIEATESEASESSFDASPKKKAKTSKTTSAPVSKSAAARKKTGEASKSSVTNRKLPVTSSPVAMDDSDDSGSARPKKNAASAQMDENQPPKAAASSKGSKKGKTVEEIYQKKTQLEHILLRPDTYIGSVETIQQEMWIVTNSDSPKDEDDSETIGNNKNSAKIEKKKISYVPGFYKIFDEILVNAADNKLRDPNMDTIKVTIDNYAEDKTCKISVYNNGKGIPIELHKKEQVYVPELIFGHLLTSSNYDDSEKKVVGGRNGYGAKLCNIFSKEFIVETADKSKKKKYKQIFRNNMSYKSEPVITSTVGKEEYTKITFIPDVERFGMGEEGLTSDIEALLKKRVYDLAGCVKNVKVYLNGERIMIRSFRQYVDMYLNTGTSAHDERKNADIVHEVVNDRWEVILTHSEGQFEQVSFVNSICTYKGGTHVTYVADQVASNLVELIKKKNKAAPVKNFQVKNQMWVFINCLIENPTFDSQTKENMTLKAASFGSKCPISDDFMNKVKKTVIIENVLHWAKTKQDQLLKKTDGAKRTRISGIAKLDDANNAGTRNGKNCTLILTEGDSAKTLAVTGLGVVGRDNYGVFPLRGKLLNVREASHKQIMENAEITAIKQILGLQQGKKYSDVDGLRYGRLMIMTDQDHDGSHIKGLIINMLDYFWPDLLKIRGFLLEFITPIVKVTKGKQEMSFFTLPEYETWLKEHNEGKGWTIKYYKGLGTSTKEDAKKYFQNIDIHKKVFDKVSDDDKTAIDMAFNKKKADQRKEWLRNFEPGTFIDHDVDAIRVKDFIDKELILFSMADNIRSIPCVVDGLKPGLRKILYSCFKRNLTKGEIKVAQLSGYVAEHSAYHHGEQSLQSSIVGMAQNFIGSNNINLLEPIGQFGSRLQGGKDAASPRYIFTRLAKLARIIFNPNDDHLLKYLRDDGQQIEPTWYIPILPLVLVNGGEGIGTGWSSFVPNYKPDDIVENLKLLISGNEDLVEMKPWYRGFNGEIKPDGSKYVCNGIIDVINDTTVHIKELPIRVWTQSYKEGIESWIVEAGAKGNPHVKDYKEFHSDSTVSFEIHLNQPLTVEELTNHDVLLKKFKLTTSISLSNMVCFDQEGRIKKYSNAKEILVEFYQLRLKYYQRRKEYLVNELTKEYEMLENKARFLTEVINDTLNIKNKKKTEVEAELQRRNYKRFGAPQKDTSAATDDTEGEQQTGASFNYLLSMPIWNLTYEKLEQIKNELEEKKDLLNDLLMKSSKDLWLADLESFLAEWRQFIADVEEAENAAASGLYKGKGSKAKAIKAPAKVEKKVATEIPKKAAPSKAVKQNTLPAMFGELKKKAPKPLSSDSVVTVSSEPHDDDIDMVEKNVVKTANNVITISDDEDEMMVDAPKKKLSKLKITDTDSDDAFEQKPVVKSKPKAKPESKLDELKKKYAKKASAPKKVESDEEDSDHGKEQSKLAALNPKPRRARVQKKVYKIDDSEEESDRMEEDSYQEESSFQEESDYESQ